MRTILSRFAKLNGWWFVLDKMEREKAKMEQKMVEQELSQLMAFTLELEDELNSVVKYE